MLKEITWAWLIKAEASMIKRKKKKKTIPVSITILNGSSWFNANAVYRERRAGWRGGWEHRKVGIMWLWPIPPLKGFLKDFTFVLLLVKEKGELGRQRGSRNHSVGWKKQDCIKTPTTKPKTCPCISRAVAHMCQAFSSTETCFLRGWPSCLVLANSWRPRGKHLWDMTCRT